MVHAEGENYSGKRLKTAPVTFHYGSRKPYRLIVKYKANFTTNSKVECRLQDPDGLTSVPVPDHQVTAGVKTVRIAIDPTALSGLPYKNKYHISCEHTNGYPPLGCKCENVPFPGTVTCDTLTPVNDKAKCVDKTDECI